MHTNACARASKQTTNVLSFDTFETRMYDMYLIMMLMQAMAMAMCILLLPFGIGKQNDTIVDSMFCNMECCTRFCRLHRHLGRISIGPLKMLSGCEPNAITQTCILLNEYERVPVAKELVVSTCPSNSFSFVCKSVRAHAEACVCWHRLWLKCTQVFLSNAQYFVCNGVVSNAVFLVVRTKWLLSGESIFSSIIRDSILHFRTRNYYVLFWTKPLSCSLIQWNCNSTSLKEQLNFASK